MFFLVKFIHSTVADPGFSGGGATPEFGAKTHYLTSFCQKLHENERKKLELFESHNALQEDTTKICQRNRSNTLR